MTPSAANKIGQSSNTTYDDSGIAPGDYYYRVTAEDGAGNISAPSGEATATVLADTDAPSRPTGLTATASGRTASLSWTASTDNVGVSGYRVFRDGTQVGTTETPSYSDGNLAAATTYTYTVAAYDAADNRSAASDPATVTTGSSSVVALDRVVTTHQSANSTSISSPAISTTQGGELLVAFLASDGPSGAGTQSFTTVAGGGLTWRLRQRTNTQAGAAEIWQAAAPNPLTNVIVTATRGGGSSQGAMTLAAFTGAELSTLGAVGAGAAGSGAPTASLTTTRAGSWVWGVGVDWDNDIARTPGAGQSLVDQYFSPSGDTYWTQRRDATTPGAGTSVTINDTAPTADRWNLSLVEIPRAGP